MSRRPNRSALRMAASASVGLIASFALTATPALAQSSVNGIALGLKAPHDVKVVAKTGVVRDFRFTSANKSVIKGDKVTLNENTGKLAVGQKAKHYSLRGTLTTPSAKKLNVLLADGSIVQVSKKDARHFAAPKATTASLISQTAATTEVGPYEAETPEYENVEGTEVLVNVEEKENAKFNGTVYVGKITATTGGTNPSSITVLTSGGTSKTFKTSELIDGERVNALQGLGEAYGVGTQVEVYVDANAKSYSDGEIVPSGIGFRTTGTVTAVNAVGATDYGRGPETADGATVTLATSQPVFEDAEEIAPLDYSFTFGASPTIDLGETDGVSAAGVLPGEVIEVGYYYDSLDGVSTDLVAWSLTHVSVAPVN